VTFVLIATVVILLLGNAFLNDQDPKP